MRADGEPVRLVAQPLQVVQHRIAGLQRKLPAAGQVEVLAAGVAVRALGDGHQGHVLHPQLAGHLQHGVELAAAAVDQHQVRPVAAGAVGILAHQAGEAPGHHLAHHGVVVAGGQIAGLDVELAVLALLEAVRAGHHHGAHGVGAGDMAVVVHLDAPGRAVQVEHVGQLAQQLGLAGRFGQPPVQRLDGVAFRRFDQRPLFAPLGAGDGHLPVGLQRQGLGQQLVFGRQQVDQQRAGRRLVVVELADEGGQHVGQRLGLVVAGEVGAVAPVLAGPVEEHLDRRLAGLLGGGDHVGVAQPGGVHALMVLHVGQRLQPVAVGGGGLERQGVAGRLHGRRQLLLDRRRAAFQEGAGIGHQGGVIRLGDAVHARRRTALDLVQQARPGPVLEHAVGTGAQQEHPLQRIQRTVDGAGRRERAVIVAAPLLGAAMLGYLCPVVVSAQQDVGERLVVAQDDVERRPQALDQVGFQQQRLDLGMGGHEHHRAGQRHHLGQPRGQPGGLGIAGDPLFDVARLAHIQHLAAPVDHAVDAGRGRGRLQRVADDLETTAQPVMVGRGGQVAGPGRGVGRGVGRGIRRDVGGDVGRCFGPGHGLSSIGAWRPSRKGWRVPVGRRIDSPQNYPPFLWISVCKAPWGQL